MSWLSDIIGNVGGTLTGSTGTQAATDTRNYLTGLYGDIKSDIGSSLTSQLGDLDWGRDNAISSVTGGYTNAQNQYNPQYQAGLASLQGPNQLIQGQAANTSQMMADALGMNGPEGIARAQGAFQTGPGFQFALNQGLESLARNANRGGMVAGGNQLQEAQRYGTGFAQQEYNNWLGRVAGREGLYSPLALQSGGRLADLQLQGGRDLSGLAERQGTTLGTLYGTSGQARSNARAGAIGQQANLAGQIGIPASRTYMDAANAQAQAAGNVWNLAGNTIGAATDIAAAFSDARLKRDIVPVGRENGHQLYQFRYVWGDTSYIGVIAQDVMKDAPEAVTVGPYGWLMVDYNRLGLKMVEA